MTAPTKALLTTVVWRDAFHNPEMVSVEDAKKDSPSGLLIMSSGLLIEEEENEDTILLAKDWLPQLDLVRNFTRIRKCDIQYILAADLWAEVAPDEISVVYFPASEGYGTVREYGNWKDG